MAIFARGRSRGSVFFRARGLLSESGLHLGRCFTRSGGGAFAAVAAAEVLAGLSIAGCKRHFFIPAKIVFLSKENVYGIARSVPKRTVISNIFILGHSYFCKV